MPRLFKRKNAFVYSLQVWLTCALLGPAIWYWIHPSGVPLTFQEFYPLALLVGLVYTCPSFLVLFGVALYLNRRQKEPLAKKFILAAIALFCAVASCLIFLSPAPAMKEIAISIFIAYSLPLLLAIFLYRLPTPRTLSADRSADPLAAPPQ